MKFTACLFDLDGTLAANEALKAEALARTCRIFGAAADRNIYKEVMGQCWEDVRNYFCIAYKISPNPEDFDTRFKDEYKAFMTTQLQPTDGAVELIKLLCSRQKKIAVVSSAKKWMVQKSLELFSLANTFEVQVSQEDVSRHKPAPDAYLLAMKKLAVPAEETLVFEDSEAGIQAGTAAGCRVIAIRHAYNIHQNLNKADRIIDNFSTFLSAL